MTALLPLSETPNHHKPVVCPLNGDAICTCGSALSEHHLNDYDGWMPADDPSDFESYVCPDPIEDPDDPSDLRSRRFEPTDDDTDCTQQTACTVCGVPMCTDHSDGFTTCTGGVHHNSCAACCAECHGQGGDL